jgi:uncharacterized membrane protein YphA (DoxX/SURF4 family)
MLTIDNDHGPSFMVNRLSSMVYLICLLNQQPMTSLHPELIVFTSAFFAILFLQSGIDKAVDWKGNFEFHTKQFENSPLKRFTLPMLVTIMVMEVSCGLMSVAGIIFFLLNKNPLVSWYADCLASLIFVALFFGLRISKDYRGAAAIVPYFIASLIAIYFIF